MSGSDKHPKRPRLLSQEELQLWRHIMQQTEPLHAHEPDYAVHPAISRKEERAAPADIPVIFPAAVANKRAVSHHPSPLAKGHYAGVDRNTALRFKRGRMGIDATLDLHGLTREEAQGRLIRWIAQAYAAQARCLLVITGKGKRAEPWARESEGVLRQLLPVWLNEPEMRRMVLAFDHARVQHGGEGAYYILLKRNMGAKQ